MLPFIDEQLTLDDISKDTGFVDVYTLDINKPYLTSHIFLLYKAIPENKFFNVVDKLSKFKSLYSKRCIKINGISYILFCFILDCTMKLIRKNCLSMISKDEKLRIGKFWKYEDVDVTDFLLGYYYLREDFKDNVVPEEDFNPKDFLTYDKKRGRLVMSHPL